MTQILRSGWTVSLLALLVACGPPGSGASEGEHADDLAGIDELHRRDRQASLAQDPAALLELWSDDPVALPPDGPVQRGRAAIEANLSRLGEAAERWETVVYEQDFAEVEVFGRYGWDWGTFHGRSRHRETGREIASWGKLLRILERSPDGSWRVHRSMWTVDSTTASPGG